MSIHHTSLYNTDDNKPAHCVVKQELITYEQTEFGLKHGQKKLSWHNKIYPFTRWMIEIGDETIWAKCVSTTNTREVWRFERFKRYRWWSSIAPSWCFFDEWMEQAKLQGGYNAN